MTHFIIQNTNITIIETKIISLIYSVAVCIIQEGCTTNGIKKKSAELKNKCLSEEIKASNCNLQNILLFCLFTELTWNVKYLVGMVILKNTE